MKKAAGWDIDLTLTTAEAGDFHLSCFDHALKEVLGIEINTKKEIDYPGKTDRGVLIEAAKMKGKEKEFYENEKEVMKVLCSYFEENIDNQKINLMPGVLEVLHYLSKEAGVINGLVTGNSEQIAKSKVRKLGIEKYFVFGGFGDEFENRSDIVKEAVRNAKEYAKNKHGWEDIEVFVFDDTPRGMKAAMEGGAKGIAVMSGFYKNPRQFSEYQPEIILYSLEELNKIKEIFPEK
jgi:phosphoglycolate phosphatase-like HAD superfamily hydrolase